MWVMDFLNDPYFIKSKQVISFINMRDKLSSPYLYKHIFLLRFLLHGVKFDFKKKNPFYSSAYMHMLRRDMFQYPANIRLGEDVLKTSSRRLQCNIFLSSKKSWRRLEDIIVRRLANTSWRRLEDVLKRSWETS